ncbi:MAG: hypothetical protein ACRCV9_20255 [Burkholderiaceae bacterium]
MKQLQLKSLAIGVALALGAHCGAMAATEQSKATAAAKAKPVKGWITAPSKKGGSGVVVRYRIDGTPAVGKAVPITLSLSGVNSEEGAQVSFGTEGTGLVMDKQRAAPQKLASYQATQMPMSVTPQAEGTFYITVTTEQNGRSSVTMIPVRVGHGKVALKPMGELVSTPEGEKIISMPAK